MPQKDVVLNEAPIVAIVVDPEFSERLLPLAREMNVWIADTPVNRPSAELFWSSNVDDSSRRTVTTFKVKLGEAGEHWCRAILPQVDLHHGEYSQSPPYSVVDVFGARLTPELRDVFAEYGFANCAERSGGFRATRVPTAA